MTAPRDSSTPSSAIQRDAADAPAPVAASLRRGGWIGEGDSVQIINTPPPVRPRGQAPREASEEAGAAARRVRTTPRPVLRQRSVARPVDLEPTGTIEQALRMRKASAPPAPVVRRPEPSTFWLPIVMGVVLLGAFGAALWASAG